jgi:glutamate-5-semialdehyde dehydrogenase
MTRDAQIKRLCQRAKAGAISLAPAKTPIKNKTLSAMARSLIKNTGYIVGQNKKDVARARREGMPDALIDRLSLTPSRIKAMADSLLNIARLKDPVGSVIETVRRPNALVIKKVRVPIGVILMIYESRPNVTSDCIGLCFKSGNAVILRGGSDAINSNKAIFNVLRKEVVRHGISADTISMIMDTDRRLVELLLRQTGLIDLVIPRGGESLIREVANRSRIPVIKHYKGICHTYVDDSADLKMAEDICFNAKVQRPGVCNAMECMLVNRRIAARFLPRMIRRLQDAGVEIRGTKEVASFGDGVVMAKESDWYREYLDLKLSVKVVASVDEAIKHIMKYGSSHSDAIVTRNKARAKRFLREVDSACVYVNASTRFTDGGQFGKGAEMGISTDKIHARGPMGLEELTSYKYVIYGNGQVRT